MSRPPNRNSRTVMNMAEVIMEPPLTRSQHHDVAILCGDEAVTYEQLADRMNRAGNTLRSLGVEKGDRVVMMVLDRPEFVYAYLGALKIGAVPVALNLRLTAEDLAYSIEDSGCAVLILDGMFVELYREIEDGLSVKPAVVTTHAESGGFPDLMELAAAESSALDAVEMAADEPAFWMYSSGTTGKPKGVVHTQRTVFTAPRHLGESIGIGRGDRIYCSSKLFFAFSLGHCLFASLHLGATTILYPDWPDAKAVAGVISKFKPTVVLSVPTFYRNLLRANVTGGEAFRNVRHYISAGEKLPAGLFEEWQAATGRPILDGIGATETCFLFIAATPESHKAGRTGKPTPGTRVKLIDDRGELVEEDDTPGVLWVRMDSVAQGYWNLDDRTRAVFKSGWYCTSDVFIRDREGFYEYHGRGDDMLKISGQWVAPGEIETEVLKNPRVAEAAVVGVPNEDGLIRLALFMVGPDGASARSAVEQELTDHLTSTLSIYKCPRRMYFVDAMPQTATGKIQRFALRKLAEEHEAARPQPAA